MDSTNGAPKACKKCIVYVNRFDEKMKPLMLKKLRESGCYNGYDLSVCRSPLAEEARKPVPVAKDPAYVLSEKIGRIRVLLAETLSREETAQELFKETQRSSFMDNVLIYGNRADAIKQVLSILESE